jgi:hypothetical protein
MRLPTERSMPSSNASESDVNSVQSRRRSEPRVKDPLGLHVVHRPAGPRKADIIFVHGLGGTSRSTWSKYKDLEYFWPHKFLPLEADIAQTRILTFGYDANFRPGSGRNVITVLDFAKDLLFELKYAKDALSEDNADLEMGKVFIHLKYTMCTRLTEYRCRSFSLYTGIHLRPAAMYLANQ